MRVVVTICLLIAAGGLVALVDARVLAAEGPTEVPHQHNAECWDSKTQAPYKVTYDSSDNPRILWCKSCDLLGLSGKVWVEVSCQPQSKDYRHAHALDSSTVKPLPALKVRHFEGPATTPDGRHVANVACTCAPCYENSYPASPDANPMGLTVCVRDKPAPADDLGGGDRFAWDMEKGMHLVSNGSVVAHRQPWMLFALALALAVVL